ncbi:MAG TPA: electron transfer flavoprotein subunit alpha/FixB family protein [Bacteroidia bacterium]|jgi:electron transfer flavoprotein alpha subunit|nr:electron transfer flavoprotein subunit alpha/FixB family protein [Bacteroidia bacterium]
MSVLVFTESSKGKIRKSSLEAVNYAANIASMIGGTVTAVIDGATDAGILGDLGKAGAKKVLTVSDDKLKNGNPRGWAMTLDQVAKAENSTVVVFSHDLMGRAIAPRLSARMKAGVVAGAVENPVMNGTKLTVRKTVFSGKATAVYAIHSDKKIITLLPNSFPVKLGDGTAEISAFKADLSSLEMKVTVKEIKADSNTTVALPEADLVVSAGRGMKDPKNWGIIEDLANALGAATACSRPIADMNWRPHHEHVGQTGITVRPNLYIAIGISGAIQHLAGVSGSKTIVVINTDKEAPFFKAADYGVIGDAFEVVPRLTEAVKKFKAAHH